MRDTDWRCLGRNCGTAVVLTVCGGLPAWRYRPKERREVKLSCLYDGSIIDGLVLDGSSICEGNVHEERFSVR